MYSHSPQEETFNDFLDSELLFIEKSMMMVTNDSPRLSQHEKQILIDPISLKESSYAYPSLEFTPPKLIPKAKLVTASLPCSAMSSPSFTSKNKNTTHVSPLPPQQSVALSRLAELKEKRNLMKSKSCGEGRATSVSDDFDMWSPKKINYPESHDKPYDEKIMIELPKFEYDHRRDIEPYFDDDDKVKCGALCLFLPGLSKGKTVKPRKKTGTMNNGEEKGTPWAISRTVSLEKFECGSWTSSAIMLQNEDKDIEDSKNLFFELPLELIRNSVNDENSPVKAAFVFDHKDIKGVLKTNDLSGRGRKSHESSRNVRFSTSSPQRSGATSPTAFVTPRLRKAREEFNVFLQAQSA